MPDKGIYDRKESMHVSSAPPHSKRYNELLETLALDSDCDCEDCCFLHDCDLVEIHSLASDHNHYYEDATCH